MFLALREIQRAKVRFILLVLAIGLLVFLVLFQIGLRDGLIGQFIGALRHQSAPVVVFDVQARKNIEGSRIDAGTQAALAQVSGVGRIGRLGESTFTVSNAVSRARATPKDQLVDAVLFGYEVTGPAAGLGAPTTLSKGHMPAGINEAVASERNRADGFDIGDVIHIEPGGADITVVGLAADINYSVSPTLFVSWDTFEAAKRVRNPDATAVLPSVMAVEPAAGVSVGVLVANLAAVPGVVPLSRADAVAQSPGVASVSQSLNTVIGLLVITALMVIGLFILILTVQKSASLTLMRAIGAHRRTLALTLVLQTTVVVLAGVIVGGAMMAAISPLLNSIGVSFDLVQLLVVGAGAIVVGWVGSLGAVLRVLRIEPINATVPQGMLR
ncbi:unannotated protein [freshwater metagenome]|uniref:Unannotated protein n=1 Tax=freshwater metagenome TaxID=449393 RepID=A0A6J7FGK5_9ZZZZ|nr:FtsX-like permease family protein [Actinomycetota bacterium]